MEKQLPPHVELTDYGLRALWNTHAKKSGKSLVCELCGSSKWLHGHCYVCETCQRCPK